MIRGGASTRVRALVVACYGTNVSSAARNIGVPQRTLYRLVRQKQRNAKASTLHKIARHFDTDVEWLVGAGGTPPEKPGRIAMQMLQKQRAVERSFALLRLLQKDALSDAEFSAVSSQLYAWMSRREQTGALYP